MLSNRLVTWALWEYEYSSLSLRMLTIAWGEHSEMDFTVYEYNYILKLVYNEHQNLIRCHADADTLKFISDIEFKLRNIVNA